MPVLETVTSVFLLAGDGTEQNRGMCDRLPKTSSLRVRPNEYGVPGFLHQEDGRPHGANKKGGVGRIIESDGKVNAQAPDLDIPEHTAYKPPYVGKEFGKVQDTQECLPSSPSPLPAPPPLLIGLLPRLVPLLLPAGVLLHQAEEPSESEPEGRLLADSQAKCEIEGGY